MLREFMILGGFERGSLDTLVDKSRNGTLESKTGPGMNELEQKMYLKQSLNSLMMNTYEYRSLDSIK